MNNQRRELRSNYLCGMQWAVAGLAMFLGVGVAQAQLSYTKGQHIEPAYEGWEQNKDGSFSFVFGYMNNNWGEEIDLPVGESNNFSPGDADRGQPTHFLPRRNRFIFKVPVPADWGTKELVWTLTANGVTKKAYASLKPDYLVDNMVIASENGSLGAGTSSPESRANIAPALVVGKGKGKQKNEFSVSVGKPLKLRAQVQDDGIPKPLATATAFRRAEVAKRFADGTPDSALRPPSRITVGKTIGLHLSWFVYRGEGGVRFDPQQVKIWEDTRASANSPWGPNWSPPPIPKDGWYEVNVTFDKPGTYVLGARADDGGLFTDKYVTVNVKP
jgi:hypothetical protein